MKTYIIFKVVDGLCWFYRGDDLYHPDKRTARTYLKDDLLLVFDRLKGMGEPVSFCSFDDLNRLSDDELVLVWHHTERPIKKEEGFDFSSFDFFKVKDEVQAFLPSKQKPSRVCDFILAQNHLEFYFASDRIEIYAIKPSNSKESLLVMRIERVNGSSKITFKKDGPWIAVIEHTLKQLSDETQKEKDARDGIQKEKEEAFINEWTGFAQELMKMASDLSKI